METPSQAQAQAQAQVAGPLRRLLPGGRGGGTPSPETSSPGSAAAAARKKRQATTAACGACRKRKSKCNGERPKCSVCRDRNTECEFDTNAAETHAQALKRKYSELQSQKSAYEQIYDILQARPQREAEEVFHRIRRGADADSILRHVNYGDVLVQLALVPEARYRYEFPYMSDMPVLLQRPDNPYLDSEIYAWSRPGPPGPNQQLCRSGIANGTVAPDRDPYMKPYHAAEIMHQWLDMARPSRWTSVSTDDTLMRKLLQDYFLYEYDWFTFFHKELLLEDMVNERHRFCSSLLVNTLLAYGSYCHRGLEGRAEYWNPKNIGYQFLAEAKRLFEIDSEEEKPPRNDPNWELKYRKWEEQRLATIQASLLLNVIYDINGSDKIGWRYTRRAVELGNEIQLFRAPFETIDSKMRCARDITAWGLFSWQSMNCYHYFKAPLLSEPPERPLPNPSEHPEWYGETWVRYPMNQTRSPTYHGHLFKAQADLWAIMNDFSVLSFGNCARPRKLSVDQVYGFYKRLVSWLDNLPEPLTPRKIVMPHQIKLHMHYNLILINILKPIALHDWAAEVQPKTAFFHAKIRFETVIRLYYLRHGFEALDTFLLQFLGSLTQISIDDINAHAGLSIVETLRSTALLAMKGIYDQGRSHYLARAVLRLQSSLMRPEDVELLKHFAKVEPDEDLYGRLDQPIQSDWPTYVVGYDEDPDNQRLGASLAKKLEALSLERSASSTAASSPV